MKLNRTRASPGTFFTVSGTARMVPAEDLKVHIGSKQRVDIVYYHLALNRQPTVERKFVDLPNNFSNSEFDTFESLGRKNIKY